MALIVSQSLSLDYERDQPHFADQEKTQAEGGTVHFWRTKDKAEVDFIINSADGAIPVEVKCREIGRSLRGFIAKYKPKEAWVVSLGAHEEEKLKKTRVRFTPFYELL